MDETQRSTNAEDGERAPEIKTFWVVWHSVQPWLGPLFSVGIVVLAAWLLRRELATFRAEEVVESLRSVHVGYLLLSLGFTLASYGVMVGYDWLGTKAVRYSLSLKQIAIVSWLYYTFSNSLGPLFGGTPVRIRLYSSWGMPTPTVVRMLLIIAVAFWVGLSAICGLLFVAFPIAIPQGLHFPVESTRPFGMVLLGFVLLYLTVLLVVRKPLVLFGRSLQLPPFHLTLAQIVVFGCDFFCASAALYVLMPESLNVDYLTFTTVFMLAILASVVSHVPGGIGIFELVFLTALTPDSHELVASLLVYRVIYYLLPLLISVVGIGVSSLRAQAERGKMIAEHAKRWAQLIGPRIITGAVFLAGILLLLSGSLPTADGRMEMLRRLLPLPIVEMSHFMGSLVGAGLMILARGLQRRINVAWGLTILLLALGIVFSLSKGFDFEEAAILGVLCIGLLPCRSHFSRRGRLLAPSWSMGWILAFATAMVTMGSVLLFAFQHVEYSHDLWWEFAFQGDAPRSLRAWLGVMVVLALFAIGRLFQPHVQPPALASEEELNTIVPLVESATTAQANLVYLGDKRILVSEDRQAFLMYGCQNTCWISMGDPIGPSKSSDEVAWLFRESCDVAGVTPVYYQVEEGSLGRYIDMGMTLIKIGESARVSLRDFSLEGSTRKDLRRSKKKAAEAGLRFQVVPRSEVPAMLPQLRAISELWLAGKSGGEKGFSLGYFDERYLSRFDIALVTMDEKPVAFANLWRAGQGQELSVDLMRYQPDIMHGVMDYLFVELILYGQQEGYAWFDLGMAPFSGASPHRLAPLWNHISNFTYLHGERFYRFRGLRAYKQKFAPQWSPRYLAVPNALVLPRVLKELTQLISGNVLKLIR